MPHSESSPTDESTTDRPPATAPDGNDDGSVADVRTSRRSILGALGAGALAATGGLGAFAGSAAAHGEDVHTYVRCSNLAIPLSELPVAGREEAATALADGVYAAEERPRIVEMLDPDSSYILDRGAYYSVSVERLADGSYEFSLVEDPEPTVDSSGTLTLENDDDVAHTVSVTVTAEDGAVVLDESVDLDPGASEVVWEHDVIGRYGLTVETADGQREQRDVSITQHVAHATAGVDAAGEPVISQAAVTPWLCSFEPGFETHHYEPCERLEISYSEFPEDVRAELDAALENGGAATFESPPLLLQTMNVYDSYVRVEGTTYTATVTETTGGYELALEEPEELTVTDPRDLQVVNNAAEARTLDITLADGDEVLFDEMVTLEADETRVVHREFVVGTYDLRVESEAGEVATWDWDVSASGFDALVQVGADGSVDATQAVADLAMCEFDTAPAIELGEYEPQPHGEDDLYRDVDGTGSLGSNDVVVFFEHVEDDAVQDHPEYFDFNGSGGVGFDDVVALFQQV